MRACASVGGRGDRDRRSESESGYEGVIVKKKKKGVCGGEREKGATSISLRNDRVFTFPFFHSTIAAGRRFWPLRCRPHTKSEFQFVGRLRESGIIPPHTLFVCHLYWYLCILRPCACASNSCRSRDDLALGLRVGRDPEPAKAIGSPNPIPFPVENTSRKFARRSLVLVTAGREEKDK